jgi:palmitoyltransferase ZDHHC9/14/18
MASAIIAGTKRKLQEALGMGSGSRSAPNSPKKRKLLGNSALTKKENARAEAVAAREKAAKKAEEEAAQLASRENRALRRSASMTMSARRRVMRKAGRHSMPALTTTRRTTVNFKRQTPKSLPKAGALKSARKPGFTSVLKHKIPASKVTKRASKPKAPVRESTPESELVSDSEESPNITPASLRSANKNKKYMQTKLPFKPLNLNRSTSRISDTLDFPDSEDDEGDVERSTKSGKGRGKKAAGKASVGSKGRASSSSSRHDLSSLQNLFSTSN